MAHDVFISYSHHDVTAADAICDILKAGGIRTWIGPRDVPIGSNYAACITQAIQQSKALLVVFSVNADASIHVAREVDAAINLRIPLIPVRIARASPSVAMKRRLGQSQWLDAFDHPLDHYKEQIISRTRQALSLQGIMLIARPMWMRSRNLALIAAAVVAVALLAARMAFNPSESFGSGRTTPLSGRWQLDGSDCLLSVGTGNDFAVPYQFSDGCQDPLRASTGKIIFLLKGSGVPGFHEGDDGPFHLVDAKTLKAFWGSFRKSTGFLGLGHKSLALHADGLPKGTWHQISDDDPK